MSIFARPLLADPVVRLLGIAMLLPPILLATRWIQNHAAGACTR